MYNAMPNTHHVTFFRFSSYAAQVIMVVTALLLHGTWS